MYINSRICGLLAEIMNTTFANGYTGSANQTSDQCITTSSPLWIVALVFFGLVIVENIFFLITVLMYRQKLKHATIYLYVASGLVGNIVWCMVIFYHNINQVVGLQPIDAVHVWAFQKGSLVYFIYNNSVSNRLQFSFNFAHIQPAKKCVMWNISNLI